MIKVQIAELIVPSDALGIIGIAFKPTFGWPSGIIRNHQESSGFLVSPDEIGIVGESH